MCKILQSFVVALPHIPAHRKAVIFNQLLQIIGLNDYLWITIIQSIDYYLVQSNDLLDFTNSLTELSAKQQHLDNKHEKRLRDTLKTSISSMISLHVQFEPSKIIQTSIYLAVFLNKYLNSLFETAFKLITSSNASNNSNLNLPANKIHDKQIYSHLACQLDNYNLLQMKYLAYNLLTFVSDLIVSEELLIKLAELYEEKQESQFSTEYNNLFQNFLEKILILILKLTQVFNSFEQYAIKIKNVPNSQQQLAVITDLRKFHKAILNKSYDLMERTISLLNSKQFINAIQRLIKHESIQIRRRMLALLNNKLRKYEPTEQDTTLLISMIDDLIGSLQLTNLDSTLVMMDTDESTTESALDIEINNQTILFSIKLLCKRIGEQNPLAFVKVIKFMSENLINTKLYIKDLNIHNINLLSSVLLCAGELCLKLKSSSLIYLNQIMTFTLEIIDVIRAKCGHENDLNDDFEENKLKSSTAILPALSNKNLELLTLSCVSCLLKIVQNMAKFLSPFLTRLLFISCSLSSLVSNAGRQVLKNESLANAKLNSNFPQIELKLTNLRSALATLIPLRLLAPILNENSLFKSDSASSHSMTVKNLEFYMEIVKIAIKNADQEDLLSNIRVLRSMFMNLFDIRTIYDNKYNQNKKKNTSLIDFVSNNIGKYEAYVIEAFCELIFKLSEDLFRPIFFTLYEWATINEPPKDRLITFYSTTLKYILYF